MLQHPVIDDLSAPHPQASGAGAWALVSDRVMGGVSAGRMTRAAVRGRAAIRMQGQVRLENNGGFVQIALDLAPDGGTVDARGWQGIEIDACGNGEVYGLHLRTPDCIRPWQSFRAQFTAGPHWQTHRLPFADFQPHRIDAALDRARLRRLGVVAIGRAFVADLAIRGLRFYG